MDNVSYFDQSVPWGRKIMSLVDVHAFKKNEPDPYSDPKRNEPKEKLLIFRTFNSSNEFPILLLHIILVGNNFGDLD